MDSASASWMRLSHPTQAHLDRGSAPSWLARTVGLALLDSEIESRCFYRFSRIKFSVSPTVRYAGTLKSRPLAWATPLVVFFCDETGTETGTETGLPRAFSVRASSSFIISSWTVSVSWATSSLVRPSVEMGSRTICFLCQRDSKKVKGGGLSKTRENADG